MMTVIYNFLMNVADNVFQALNGKMCVLCLSQTHTFYTYFPFKSHEFSMTTYQTFTTTLAL